MEESHYTSPRRRPGRHPGNGVGGGGVRGVRGTSIIGKWHYGIMSHLANKRQTRINGVCVGGGGR